MNEKELRGLIKSQLKNVINEAKGLKLKVEVPMRDPEIKKFIHNYLLLNKKYSMHRMPEYSMKFGENKWKKETHWKFDTANNILYVHDEKVVDQLVKGGAPSDLFESNLNENKGQDLADKYVAILRKEFRKLNDDELDEFKKTIAQSLDLNESVVTEDKDKDKWLLDINDPVLMAIRHWKREIKKSKPVTTRKKISTKQYYKLMDKEIDIIDQMKDATKEFEQLDSDMNQEAGQKGDSWSDDDANRYGGELDRLQTKIEKLAKQKAKVKDDITNYRIN